MKRIVAFVLAMMMLSGTAWAENFWKGEWAFWEDDYYTALAILTPLAEAGHARAQYRLGHMYYLGKGVSEDKAEAKKWLRRAFDGTRAAAEAGIPDAQWLLADMYTDGSVAGVGIVERDLDTKRRWEKRAEKGYRRAAEAGDVLAKHRVAEDPYAFVYETLRPAAEAGSARAQYLLAWGGPWGLAEGESEKWLRELRENTADNPHYHYHKLAEAGNAEAQSYLELVYNVGWLITPADAAKWTRKAAEAGDADSLNALGNKYYRGEGVLLNHRQAAEWYRKAAEMGHADAQNNLGGMYANGRGVEQNNVVAYMWYNLAAAQGHEDASVNRDVLTSDMSSTQINEAQDMSQMCLDNNYQGCGR